MFLDIVSVLLGLLGLFFGGNWLVHGAARLAYSFKVSSLVIGLTVVAFGTSAPELVVCVDAAQRGASDIALGNVVGSNIANIGLILGLTALIFPIRVQWQLIRREIPIMILVALAALVLAQDGEIGALDGVLLLIGLASFIALMYTLARRERRMITLEVEAFEVAEHMLNSVNRGVEALRFALGLIVLLVGAQLLVGGAAAIARALGVSELVIGLTLVAVGTSLPELATSIVAAIRRQSDIALGNVVGSNIMNVLAILGITAIVRPIPVDLASAQNGMLIMLAFAVLPLPIALNLRIARWEAAVMLLGYIAFVAISFT